MLKFELGTLGDLMKLKFQNTSTGKSSFIKIFLQLSRAVFFKFQCGLHERVLPKVSWKTLKWEN